MTDTRRIYLDYAATAPMLDVAKKACTEGFEQWANPSSPHGDGRAAQAMLENARRRFREALHWDGDVIFTSGASEAVQIALTKSKPETQLVSPVEHDVVLRFAPGARQIPVDGNGMVVPANLDHLLKGVEGPALVARPGSAPCWSAISGCSMPMVARNRDIDPAPRICPIFSA